jgi:predicted phage gp36 major capsid-like protein
VNFLLHYTEEAQKTLEQLKEEAEKALENRKRTGKTKASKQEGLFKQVIKTLGLLADNPKHPSLHSHEYSSIDSPFHPSQKVFEAYAQNNTPGAYRVFWCYGPQKGDITIVTITPHP